MTHRLPLLALLLLAIAACGGTSPADDGGAGGAGGETCRPVTTPPACPDPVPTWDDVQPVLEANCRSCHSGDPSGPWPLDTYAHVADWQHEIRAFVSTCAMPPPDSGEVVPEDDRTLLLAWIACGAPE